MRALGLQASAGLQRSSAHPSTIRPSRYLFDVRRARAAAGHFRYGK